MADIVKASGGGLAALVARNAEQRIAVEATNTARAHEGDWRRFAAWCTQHGVAPLPAPPEAIAVYLTHLEASGKRFATIERALSTIAARYRDADPPLYAPRQARVVRDTLKGLARKLGVAPRQKRPIAVGLLSRLVVAAAGDDLTATRDRAILLLGFAGAFRRSELVALDLADLAFEERFLRVQIRRSKTDQTGRGREVAIAAASDPALCPIRAARAWIELAELTEGPLFCALDRVHYGARLSAPAVAWIVKKHASKAGIDPAGYAGHSLRAGFVSSAVRAGKDPLAIRRQTGHKSAAMVEKYVRELELTEKNASEGLL